MGLPHGPIALSRRPPIGASVLPRCAARLPGSLSRVPARGPVVLPHFTIVLTYGASFRPGRLSCASSRLHAGPPADRFAVADFATCLDDCRHRHRFLDDCRRQRTLDALRRGRQRRRVFPDECDVSSTGSLPFRPANRSRRHEHGTAVNDGRSRAAARTAHAVLRLGRRRAQQHAGQRHDQTSQLEHRVLPQFSRRAGQ